MAGAGEVQGQSQSTAEVLWTKALNPRDHMITEPVAGLHHILNSDMFNSLEAGVGLGIGLCCVPSGEGCPRIYIHTFSPGSVAHMDGRLR